MRLHRARPRLARLAVGLTALLAAAAVGRAGPPPGPPAPPASGFGAPVAEDVGLARGTVENPASPGHPVTWLKPATAPAGGRPVPVVAFLHGFGALGPEPYLGWLEHLARRGAAVVYPVYPALDVRAKHSRYDVMWAGIEAGIAAARAGAGPAVDAARFGVVGHSFGGGAAPAMAARAQARGFGRDGLFVASLAPWYDLDADAWSVLPAHTLLVVAVYADDTVCDPAIGAGFLARATTVPAARKALRVFRTDRHGSPAVSADHLAPLSSTRTDTLDHRGTWRLVDALVAASTAAGASSGAGSALETALGATPDALELGTWTDGTPVTPATTSWEGTPGLRRPAWRPGGLQEDAMRRLLRPEAWSTLPLPDPAVAVPARLAASERFVDRPAPGGATAGAGPRLLVEAGAPAVVGEARLVEAGVAVVRGQALPAPPPAPLVGTTALLLDAAGRPLLWRRSDDPRFVDVALRLLSTGR